MCQKAPDKVQTAFNKWFEPDSLITTDNQAVKTAKMTADTTYSLQPQHEPRPA